MTTRYQVTLKCKSGKYRPVSCIVTYDKVDLVNNREERKTIQNMGIRKIAQKRYWNNSDLVKYEYTTVLVREFDEAEIQAKRKEAYEALKEAKYASGEWKRPKSKE